MQNFRALRAPPPDPRASGGWELFSQTPISLRRLGFPPPDPKHTATSIANSWLRACQQHGVLLQILQSFTLIFHLWSIMKGSNRGMLNLKILCCFITFQFSLLCVNIHFTTNKNYVCRYKI